MIASHMLGRTPKQCRDRWNNYLVPIIQDSEWTQEEDILLMNLYSKNGPKWKLFAKSFPGKTPNDIKNRFNKIIKENPNNIVVWNYKYNCDLIQCYNENDKYEGIIYDFFKKTGKLLTIDQARKKIERLIKDYEYYQMFNNQKFNKKKKTPQLLTFQTQQPQGFQTQQTIICQNPQPSTEVSINELEDQLEIIQICNNQYFPDLDLDLDLDKFNSITFGNNFSDKSDGDDCFPKYL